MNRSIEWAAILLATTMGGCSAREASPDEARTEGVPTPSEPGARASAATNEETDAQALDRARDAAMQLGRTLKARVIAAMAEGGPALAMRACATEAQQRTGEVATSTNARVGRSSLRLRNPANAGPEWVRTELARLGERPAAGVTPITTVAEVDGRRVARFAGPIAIEGPCLTCHGPDATLAPDVKALLAERYPDDRAVGYAEGDLRGLLWAELDVR